MLKPYFRPAFFKFLRDLKANNDRAWFEANRGPYLRDVRDPALEFITAFGAPLLKISPHFRADPRPNGGSLFRIYRDIRFSHDKSPYKTAVGLHFRHEEAKTAHTPGFYLHLEPGGCFMGVGIWRPDTPTVTKLRKAVGDTPQAWLDAVETKKFTAKLTVSGDSLKRPPRGYPADHPLVEILKLKDFTALAPLTQNQITQPDFLEEFAELCRAGMPLNRFICKALALPC